MVTRWGPGGLSWSSGVLRHLLLRCPDKYPTVVRAGINSKVLPTRGYKPSSLVEIKVRHGVVKFRLICFTVLIASLRKKKNNVLRLLLTLECLVLFLFIVLCFLGEIYFRVIFLSVGACEAAVGLGCLVGLIRLAGQNHISFTECGPY